MERIAADEEAFEGLYTCSGRLTGERGLSVTKSFFLHPETVLKHSPALMVAPH
jgi:hypothetical protein